MQENINHQTFTISGMITKILDDSDYTNIKCEINFNIDAYVILNSLEQLEQLKRRAFDTAIFNCTMVSAGLRPKVKCNTILFGKEKKFFDC